MAWSSRILGLCRVMCEEKRRKVNNVTLLKKRKEKGLTARKGKTRWKAEASGQL